MSKIEIRVARVDELPMLQAKIQQELPSGFEPVDLSKCIVHVADDDGIVAGLAAAGLIWHIEPLTLFPEFKRYAPAAAQRRAVYGLGKAITDYVNEQGGAVKTYFAHIDDPRFAALAKSFGLWKAFPGGELLKGGGR